MPPDPVESDASSEVMHRGRGFVHLHLHSEYSLLDGANRIDRLVARVADLGMDAVAVTDHGNLFGAVEFYKTARAAGIKPILGVEAYVAPGDRTDRTHTGVSDGGYHLVLLAENDTGWNNLLYLCSQAFLTGFYYKPRIDRALLATHGSGLIAINGHLGSEMGEHLLAFERTGDRGSWDKAVESARWHAANFADEGTGPRFFVELQHHIPEQNSINKHLIRLARELELPLVCDNDAHFLTAEDHDAHDSLICISMGKIKSDPDRLHYTPELYVKSPQQMRAIFEDDAYNNDAIGQAGREALDNTLVIAARCCVELPIGANHAPVVRVAIPATDELPTQDEERFGGDLSAWHKAYCALFEIEPYAHDDSDDAGALAVKDQCDAALRLLSQAGMVWRYGPGILAAKHELIEGEANPPTDEATRDDWLKWARLNRELGILADKLISAYFLIVWDFVNWGRQRGIPAMARGSGVGTMVGFVLGLSNACPVKYGLLFERFTDPDRTEYPDIDIDLCQDGRASVIEYVRRKYGHENVAQIITFGTLKARAAVRDVARVLDVALKEADAIAKAIPEQLGMTLDEALATDPDFKKLYDTDESARRVIDTARSLEGQVRHCGVHAAGVVLANRPLCEIVPLYKQVGAAEHEVVTQWDGPTCEAMGLLKMDFLGLRTLSIIERCRQLIRDSLPDDKVWDAVGRTADDGGAHPLDLDRLTCDDARVFDLFQRGDTTGVFQFESGGMRRLLVDMKPDRLEDLIAANALFRPGPMDLIPDYVRRKHGDAPVPTVHPIVDRYTAETYGVMVYQEQVMQIVHGLGGIPLRSAYALIKAISKKKKTVIDAERPRFIEGAQAQGLGKKQADELFELILKFAGYGFNKSHSTGYAIVAYQTAYLKTYFPRHAMAALLTYESQAQKIADWIPYLDDCKRTRAIDPRTGAVLSKGVEVKPPTINLSRADFSVVYEEGEERAAHTGHIRFGLKAIKGAGAKAIDAIIEERDGSGESADRQSGGGDKNRRVFSSLFEFCERVPPGVVNKATIESLIKCGAFDAVHGRDERASMVATIDQAVSAGQKAAQDRTAGQAQLFGFGGGDESASDATSESAPQTPLVRVEPWNEAQTLRHEKETLGLYVSSHPLESWSCWMSAFTNATLGGLAEMPQDKRVIAGVIVQSVRTIVCKTGRSAGQKMAVLTLEDLTGVAEAVLFADVYARYGHLIAGDEPRFVLGRVDHARGEPQIIVDQLMPIDAVPLMNGTLRLFVRAEPLNGSAGEALERLSSVLMARAPGVSNTNGGASVASAVEPAARLGGAVPVDLMIETPDAWVAVKPTRPGRVVLEPSLIEEITGLLGKQSARLVGGVALEVDDGKNRRRRG